MYVQVHSDTEGHLCTQFCSCARRLMGPALKTNCQVSRCSKTTGTDAVTHSHHHCALSKCKRRICGLRLVDCVTCTCLHQPLRAQPRSRVSLKPGRKGALYPPLPPVHHPEWCCWGRRPPPLGAPAVSGEPGTPCGRNMGTPAWLAPGVRLGEGVSRADGPDWPVRSCSSHSQGAGHPAGPSALSGDGAALPWSLGTPTLTVRFLLRFLVIGEKQQSQRLLPGPGSRRR